MKRKILSLFICFSILFSLCGCSFSDGVGIEVKVTFVCADTSQSVFVPLGEVVSPPKTPHIKGKLFSGWYTDEACENEYDFSSPVLTERVLYAGFVLDGAVLTNAITQSVMPSLVTVSNSYFINGGEWISQGSGFVYKLEGGRAYVLTNCHVAYAPTKMKTITVTDFQGEEYKATVHRRDLLADPAISADYDLAILSFPYAGDALSAIPFAKENAVVGEEVISLGSPKNQSHAITFGEVLDYRTAALPESAKEESNVTFEIIHHTAPIANGSSGGPLLNGDLALVGVNYAGIPPENGEAFGKGCAVPLDQVLQFLSLYE